MNKEQFVPFKNSEGQVNDPEIAKKMAHNQELYQEVLGAPIDSESSNERADLDGEDEHAEKMTPVVIDKIKNILSEDELKVIRRMLENPDPDYAIKFKKHLFAGLSEEEE